MEIPVNSSEDLDLMPFSAVSEMCLHGFSVYPKPVSHCKKLTFLGGNNYLLPGIIGSSKTNLT